MFRHGEISTEADKGPFIFTLAVLVGSILLGGAILIFAGTGPLNIFFAVMCAIMAVCSAVVLFGMLSDYACIENDVLTMSYLFSKKTIALKDIGQVSIKDNVYTVYDRKKNKVGTINGLATGIDRVTGEMNRKHVNFV
jgi:predicted signal transduction protein with EAL and GGDEF domain